MKLVINEPGSKEAAAEITNALKKGHKLYTVDLALAEGLSALWKHSNVLRDLKEEDANAAAEDLTKIHDKLNIVTTRENTPEAMQIALTQDITVYDALYIAAAQKTNGALFTADQKLYNAAQGITNAKQLTPKP